MRIQTMEKREITFQACGRSWRILHEDTQRLWQDMTDQNTSLWEDWVLDERLPYWAELWPSSLALAEFLSQQQKRLQGKNCLDLGCGLGFTALVGAWLGGKLIGMDYDRNAIAYARLNAEHNQITGIEWLQADWRDCEIDACSQYFIWGADISYERRFALPVLAFIKHTLHQDGICWIAEPSRAVFAHFRGEALKAGLSVKKVKTETVAALYAQAVPVPVNIWELSRI